MPIRSRFTKSGFAEFQAAKPATERREISSRAVKVVREEPEVEVVEPTKLRSMSKVRSVEEMIEVFPDGATALFSEVMAKVILPMNARSFKLLGMEVQPYPSYLPLRTINRRDQIVRLTGMIVQVKIAGRSPKQYPYTKLTGPKKSWFPMIRSHVLRVIHQMREESHAD